MTEQRPNIMILMTDEQRFDHLGIVNPVLHTPNLDKLADDSVFFSRAYTTNPSCVPARAAIFTGKFPHQCHAPTFITHLPEHETCFMKLLREAGYYTGYIGKLHFGTSTVDRGLEYQDIVDSHGPQPSQANSYQRWLYDNGFRHTDEFLGWDTGLRQYAEWKVDPKFHVDHYVGDRGLEWVENQMPEDRPWFCCISFPGPHGPIDCGNFPEAGLYDPADIDMPETTFEMLGDKPPHNSLTHGEPPLPYKPFSEENIRLVRRAYYANVTLIDRKIGDILAAMQTKGVYDNTVILFVSDHGDYMGDFQLVTKGQNVPEALMRTPFMIKPASQDFQGRRESSLVSSVDIAATCLNAAGVSTPDYMASRDLSHYWNSNCDLDDRDLLYMEAGGIRCLRDRRWKFCHYQDRSYGELYDLKNDPWETCNLWDDPRYEQLKARFSGQLVDTLIKLSPRSYIPWNKGAPVI